VLVIGAGVAALATDCRGRSAPLERLAAPAVSPLGPAAESGAAAPAPPTTEPAAGSDEAPGVHPVFHADWGTGPNQLGRRMEDESAPEGPMSFAVDAEGRAYVLDQVNSRVQVFEAGRVARSVPLPSDGFQDIALRSGGGLALLDRHTAGSVAFLNASGQVEREVALKGKGVPEAGAVTALFERNDGTWVEVEHGRLVRVADANGAADVERPEVRGRFAADGSGSLLGAKTGAASASVVRVTGNERMTRLASVDFDLPLWQLLSLDSDPQGRIYLLASLVKEAETAPFDVIDAAEVLVVLDASGKELARHRLPAQLGPEESLRRARIGADGVYYHLAFDDSGATMRKVRL
jgi:hypothetical protein